jgi:hypothetical protein
MFTCNWQPVFQANKTLWASPKSATLFLPYLFLQNNLSSKKVNLSNTTSLAHFPTGILIRRFFIAPKKKI